jgi:hypothetical protein
MWGRARETERLSVISKISAERLASIIREGGFKAIVERDADGRLYIGSASNGWNTVVRLTGNGRNGEFTSFQFVLFLNDAEKTVNLSKMNDFNSRWRYVKGLILEDNAICLQMDIDLDGGVSELYLANRVTLWDNLVGTFRALISG